MGKNDFFKKCVITTAGNLGPSYTPENMKRWIEARKGKHSTSLTEETTHVVVSTDYWERQGALVTQALKRTDVKIVTKDWLEESLGQQRKHSLAGCEWPKIDRKRLKQSKPKPAPNNKRKASKGHYADALLEHTKQFAGSADTSRDETPAEAPVVDDQAASAQKRARTTFKRGTKTAKFDLHSDNHHVYQDSTGFRYEVFLLKVENSKNWNERAWITLYQSHSTPGTYACHFKSINTLGLPEARTLSAIGCNYDTALAQFKAIFEEKTGIAWDDRFERCERRKPGQLAPSMTSTNSGFITPQLVMAKGGGRDPDAPREDEKLLGEFKARPLNYRTPSQDEPQGDLPPHKMGHLSMTQAGAGALEEYDPSQHSKSLDDIIGTSSDDQEAMPAATSQQHYSETIDEAAQADDVDMMGATVSNSTNEGTTANVEPEIDNVEGQETKSASETHPVDQVIGTTSESQASDQEETTIPTSASVDLDMMHTNEAHRQRAEPKSVPAPQTQEQESSAAREKPQTEQSNETTSAMPQPVYQEMAHPNETHLEREESTTIPAPQAKEQEPTTPQKSQTEDSEHTNAAAQPAEGHTTESEDPQDSRMADSSAEDMMNVAENEHGIPQ